MSSTIFYQITTISRRLNLFWALSRTPHGLIDMTAPAMAALLCLGHFPPLPVVLLGLITVFAGYTAVYAINDVVDYRMDKEKVRVGGYNDSDNYLDGVLIRHPMAKDMLKFRHGLAWGVGWALVAMGGAYLLNPICMYIFIAGCVLEITYCLLLRVSPLRVLVNGVVKTCGPLAAMYAVTPSPPLFMLTSLFIWIFFWEIGGQNIPADWTDIEEDRYLKAQTIPVKLGLKRAGLFCVVTLLATTFLSFIVFWASPLTFGPFYLLLGLVINIFLLLWPSLELAETRKRKKAMALFNRASYYPIAVFGLVLLRVLEQAVRIP
jgi:4-hydroxybenzoate polyprenyltransferase